MLGVGGNAGLFILKSWNDLQDMVPNVQKLESTQIPIKWRVIYMDVDNLLDVSCDPHGSLSKIVKYLGLTGCPVDFPW